MRELLSGFFEDKRIWLIFYLLESLIIIAGVAFLVAIFVFANNSRNRKEVFTSPQKTNTIIVKYDFVSRPTVYKKTWIGKKKIWKYDGTGFMEEVRFKVEWLNENQFKISYTDGRNSAFDEEFIVSIP